MIHEGLKLDMTKMVWSEWKRHTWQFDDGNTVPYFESTCEVDVTDTFDLAPRYVLSVKRWPKSMTMTVVICYAYSPKGSTRIEKLPTKDFIDQWEDILKRALDKIVEDASYYDGESEDYDGSMEWWGWGSYDYGDSPWKDWYYK
jgi:hypothetical protein